MDELADSETPSEEAPKEKEPEDSIQVRELVLLSGESPFATWYEKLRDRQARLRIAARLARVRAGNLGDFKSVGDGIYELRVFYGPGYRLYFARIGETIVILVGGGDKSSQSDDIAVAQALWADFGEKNASP